MGKLKLACRWPGCFRNAREGLDGFCRGCAVRALAEESHPKLTIPHPLLSHDALHDCLVGGIKTLLDWSALVAPKEPLVPFFWETAQSSDWSTILYWPKPPKTKKKEQVQKLLDNAVFKMGQQTAFCYGFTQPFGSLTHFPSNEKIPWEA